MKKTGILLITLLAVALSGCSKETDQKKEERWDCTVACAEDFGDDSYVITYSEEEITTATGTLSIQNRNDFDITVHLQSDKGEEEERTVEIPAGGVSILHQLSKNISYKIGCHADVEEGVEIKCMVYEGETAEHD